MRSPETRPLVAARRPADRLPRVACWATAAVGLLNLGSVLTPDVRERARLLRGAVPHELPLAAHALALASGVTLLLLAWYLGRRRRRAWALTLGVLAIAGALNLVKGLDLEEAAANWALAAVLWWGRDAFWVRPGPEDAATVARRLALVGAGWLLAPAAAIVAASHWAAPPLTPGRVLSEEWHLLLLSPGPLHFGHPFGWVPEGVGVLSAGALAAAAALVFRPRSLRRTPAGPEARRVARGLVRSHGSDTLAGFKLRRDNGLFFSSDHRAFCAYTVESGVLLVSGDPIGEPAAIPGLVRELAAFAEGRGLRLAVLGACGAADGAWAPLRLRSLYIGDEAIVETARFSLEGRRIRKVRQSVTRLCRHGYVAEARRLRDLSASELAALEDVSAAWRGGEPERGFSMALDSLRGEHLDDSLVVIARDGDGRVGGFLHFVPCYGRAAASLSFMRRRRDTPNGLTEFLVVRAIELLRERGIDEVSLNFAAFGRLFHAPAGLHERLAARVMAVGDRFFQIERLYRFNAKFAPRWEPRYLLYESVLGLPRAGLAALWAEGQLPKPVPRRTTQAA